MIDDPRVPTSTYKVEVVDNGLLEYIVTTFPHVDTGHGSTQAKYRADMLPQWMKEGMALLDTAGEVVATIKNLGQKTGGAYWFWSKAWWDLNYGET